MTGPPVSTRFILFFGPLKFIGHSCTARSLFHNLMAIPAVETKLLRPEPPLEHMLETHTERERERECVCVCMRE